MPVSIDLKKLARLQWSNGALISTSHKKDITSYLAIKGDWVFWSIRTITKRPLWFDDEVEYEFSADNTGERVIDETGEVAENIFKIVDEKSRIEARHEKSRLEQQLNELLG